MTRKKEPKENKELAEIRWINTPFVYLPQSAYHIGTSDGFLFFEVTAPDGLKLNGEYANQFSAMRSLVEQVMQKKYPIGPFVKWKIVGKKVNGERIVTVLR